MGSLEVKIISSYIYRMGKLTKGQSEVKLSEAMMKLQKGFVGRGPEETDTIVNLAKVKRASRKQTIIGFV